jgi:hypothetical protein
MDLDYLTAVPERLRPHRNCRSISINIEVLKRLAASLLNEDGVAGWRLISPIKSLITSRSELPGNSSTAHVEYRRV